MRRLLMAVVAVSVLIGVGFAHQPSRAAADVIWCWDDPVVLIDGRLLSINLGLLGDPALIAARVEGVEIDIYLPKGAGRQLVSTTGVFRNEQVEFLSSETPWSAGQPVPVTVVASFKGDGAIPSAMTITLGSTTLAGVTGTIGSYMRAQVVLP